MIKETFTTSGGYSAILSLSEADTYTSDQYDDDGYRKFKTSDMTLRGVVRVKATKSDRRIDFCLSPVHSFCGAVFVDYFTRSYGYPSWDQCHSLVKDVVRWLRFNSFLHVNYGSVGLFSEMEKLTTIYNATTCNTVGLYITKLSLNEEEEDDY